MRAKARRDHNCSKSEDSWFKPQGLLLKKVFRTYCLCNSALSETKKVAAHKPPHHRVIRALAIESSRIITTSHPFHQKPSGGCITGGRTLGTVREKNLQLSSNQGVSEVSTTFKTSVVCNWATGLRSPEIKYGDATYITPNRHF